MSDNAAARMAAEPVAWKDTGDYRWIVRGPSGRAVDRATGGRARVLQRKFVSQNRNPQIAEWRDVPVVFESP